VVGIIVPSSILSNSDMTHIVTREIFFKYFGYVPIVELGVDHWKDRGTITGVYFFKEKSQRTQKFLRLFWTSEPSLRGDWEKTKIFGV